MPEPQTLATVNFHAEIKEARAHPGKNTPWLSIVLADGYSGATFFMDDPLLARDLAEAINSVLAAHTGIARLNAEEPEMPSASRPNPETDQ